MVNSEAARSGALQVVYAGLRDGGWATPARLRAYALLAIAVYVAATVGVLALSSGGIGHDGQPVGTDFASYWNAARLALAGQASVPYDAPAFAAAQRDSMGAIPFYAFFYPPTFLLLIAPLGTLPYLAALGVFLGSTFLLAAVAARRIVPGDAGLLTIAAAPASFIALGHGQNAFLMAGLLGLALTMLDRRPVTAGLLMALATIKPQLALLLPVALVAGGRWRTLIAAGLGALGFAGLAAVAFGPEIWDAFLDQVPFAGLAMRDGIVPWGKMITVYAAKRVLGAGEEVALALQAASLLASVVLVALVWRDRAPARAPLRAAILLAAIPLAAPVALDYDLVVLLPAILWLAAHWRSAGCGPWEMSVVALAYTLPFFARPLALQLSLPIAPFVLMLLLGILVRRWHAHGAAFGSRVAEL